MAQVVGKWRGIVAMAIDEPLPSPRPPFCRRRWKAGKPTGAREKTHRRAGIIGARAREISSRAGSLAGARGNPGRRWDGSSIAGS